MSNQGADQAVTVRFATGVFDLEAVKRAAYRFSDRLVIDIVPGADAIACTLRALSSRVAPASLEAEFRNEVLDQDLRLKIGKETEQLRNLVLSLAFSKTGLQE